MCNTQFTSVNSVQLVGANFTGVTHTAKTINCSSTSSVRPVGLQLKTLHPVWDHVVCEERNIKEAHFGKTLLSLILQWEVFINQYFRESKFCSQKEQLIDTRAKT